MREKRGLEVGIHHPQWSGTWISPDAVNVSGLLFAVLCVMKHCAVKRSFIFVAY